MNLATAYKINEILVARVGAAKARFFAEHAAMLSETVQSPENDNFEIAYEYWQSCLNELHDFVTSATSNRLR